MGRRIVVILVILIILLAVGGAAALLVLNPEALESVGGGQPTPEPTEEPSVSVIIAAIDIDAGTVITDTATYLDTQPIPESDYNNRSSEFLTSVQDVQNMLLTTDLAAGRPILASNLTIPGLSQRVPEADDPDEPRPKAYPLEVNSLTGVADQIQEGDFVDVVATYPIDRFVQITETRIEPVTFYSTKTIVQRAEVLRVVRPPVDAPSEEDAPAPGEDVQQPEQGAEPQVDEAGRPIRPTQAQTGEGGAATITPGTWIVVLAVTAQEAEALEYSDRVTQLVDPFTGESEADIALILRGADDDEDETTLGATLQILYSDFDVPVPGPVIFPLFEDIE